MLLKDIFLDDKEAFDRVWHDVLLHKLKSTPNWPISYIKI